MSFVEILEQAERLTLEERRVLVRRLQSLDDVRSPEHRRRMTALINDKDPGKWISLEDLPARLEKADHDAK